MRRLLTFCVLTVSALAASDAYAVIAIDIKNPSFEADAAALPNNSNFQFGLTDWGTGNAGAFNPGPADITPEAIDGDIVAFSNSSGFIFQNLFFESGDAVTANEGDLISINFWTGRRTQFTGGTLSVSVRTTLPNGNIDVTPRQFLDITSQDSGTWVQRSLLFEVGSGFDGTPLLLAFDEIGSQVLIDDVSAHVVTPEPASAGLALIGMGSLAFIRRRRLA